jgi:hypothetical protein
VRIELGIIFMNEEFSFIISTEEKSSQKITAHLLLVSHDYIKIP